MIEAAMLVVVLIGQITGLYLKLIQVQMVDFALSGSISAVGNSLVKVKQTSALYERVAFTNQLCGFNTIEIRLTGVNSTTFRATVFSNRTLRGFLLILFMR